MGDAEVQGDETSRVSDLQAEYPRVCRFLQTTDNQAADGAVIKALPKVSPQVAGVLVKLLVDRGRERGLVGLVRIYHLLPAAEQRRLAAWADRLSGALREAMAEPGSRQRINAISLIRHAPGARQAYLLATAVCDSAPSVSEPAAEALAALVSGYVDGQSGALDTEAGEGGEAADPRPEPLSTPSGGPPSTEQYLLEAIRQTLDAFHIHRRDRVVEAAMQLAGCPGPSFEVLFGDPPARIFRAVLDLFRSRSDPAWVGFAFRALASRKWREPVARAVGQRVRPAFVVGMIRQSHRLGEPGVRQGLRSVRKLAWLRNGAAPLLSLPQELMESAVRFILALGLPVAAKADLMRELILTGPPAAQKPALEALIREAYDPTGRLLRTVAGWGDPAVSPRAQRALPLHHDFVLPGTLSAASPPPSVGPLDPPLSFDSFWSRFGRLGRTARRRMAEAARGRLPYFDESLRSKCRNTKPAQRLQAVGVVRCLQLESSLSTEIMRLARDDDRIVRSAALTALGHTPGPINRRLLLEALQDHDTRVQANAIEVLDRLGYDHELAALECRRNEANNRVRANLGRAFLRFRPRTGAEILEAMLASPDRSCRISALWVIRDRGPAAAGPVVAGLTNRLQDMARTEPDPQIRRRAATVLAGSAAGGPIPGDFFFEELSR